MNSSYEFLVMRQVTNEDHARFEHITGVDIRRLEHADDHYLTHRLMNGTNRAIYMDAFRDGILTVDALLTARYSAQLCISTHPECISAIRDGIYTLQDLVSTRDNDVVQQLTNSEVINLIRDGILTLNQVKQTDPTKIYWITRPTCLSAIRNGDTTVEYLITLRIHILAEAVRNNDFRLNATESDHTASDATESDPTASDATESFRI